MDFNLDACINSPMPMRLPADGPLHGGINVCVRIRPLSKNERKCFPFPVVVSDDGCSVKVLDPKKPLGAPSRTYGFSQVFGPESSQKEVYDNAIAPVVIDVVNGYNCTVFAYGQTGTGKTYTMEGARSDPSLPWDEDPTGGMIPRAVHHLFDALNAAFGTNAANPSIVLSVSYFELYNENVFDLLSSTESGKQRPSLQILEDPERKGSVVVKGATKKICKTKEEVIALLEIGASARKKASTNLNNQSSRSHAIFMVTVYMNAEESDTRRAIRSGPKQHVRTGKLNLVDLAGSESIGRSGAKDAHAREAGSINKSLLNLKLVIDALVQSSTNPSVHVPYRGSKLTRLLQDSLGGKTKTTIIAAVSPVNDHLEETISTLEYACKAKSIVNRPEVSDKEWGKVSIADYIDRIERLSADLLATREQHGVYLPHDEYESLQAAKIQRSAEYKRKQEDLLAAQDRKTELEEVYRALQSRLEELAAIVDEREKVAREAAEFGRSLEEKHKQCKARGEEIVAVAKKGLRDLNAVSDAAERLREVNISNRRAYESFLHDFESAASSVTEAAGSFGLPPDPAEEADEFIAWRERMEAALSSPLAEMVAHIEAASAELLPPDPAIETEGDLDAELGEIDAWVSKTRKRAENGWKRLAEVCDAQKVENQKLTVSLRTADSELDAGSLAEATAREAAERKLAERCALKTRCAAQLSEDFAAGEAILDDAAAEVDSILESIARLRDKLRHFDVSATGASSKMETAARKLADSRRESMSILADGVARRDAHFDKAEWELISAGTAAKTRASSVERTLMELIGDERAGSETVARELDDALAGSGSALAEKKNGLETIKREAVNAFMCSELSRRVLQENLEKKTSEAEKVLYDVESTSDDFVSRLKSKWFQEVPKAVKEICSVAESGTAEMAEAFGRLSSGEFVEYQSTGCTPARRGSGSGTPLRLPRFSTPSTPREAMLQRHREVIGNLELAEIETPPESSLSEIHEDAEVDCDDNKENVACPSATPVRAYKAASVTSSGSSTSSVHGRRNVVARK